MQLDPELIEELSLLRRISLNLSEDEIDLSTIGDRTVVAAAVRLFEKGIISRPDGGQLTDSGRDAVEHESIV